MKNIDKRVSYLLDVIKLYDAPLGDELATVYNDPVTTDEDKEKFVSVMAHIAHGTVTDKDIMELVTLTAEILTTRKLLNKIQKKG